METRVEKIYHADAAVESRQPLFIADVPAGFPSPAGDYEQESLDLNKFLIKNSAATYFVRVSGDSMLGAGIHSGDLLVVDRSIEPADKKIVIANINGQMTVKRLRIKKGKLFLESENSGYPPQAVGADCAFEIWGVVTSVIHAV
jgi:DNA polymerase V